MHKESILSDNLPCSQRTQAPASAFREESLPGPAIITAFFCARDAGGDLSKLFVFKMRQDDSTQGNVGN